MNEARGETSDSLKSEDKTKILVPSMGYSSSKQGLEMTSNEQASVTAFNVGFSSMPAMHINERVGSACDDTVVDVGGSTYSKSCPESIAYPGSSKLCTDGFLPFHQFEGSSRKKLFAPYWPMEAVNEALEVCLKFALII